jgi:hypothetical protein
MTLLKRSVFLLQMTVIYSNSGTPRNKTDNHPKQVCRKHPKGENRCNAMSKSRSSMWWDEDAARTRGNIHTKFWLKNVEKTKTTCKTHVYVGAYIKLITETQNGTVWLYTEERLHSSKYRLSPRCTQTEATVFLGALTFFLGGGRGGGVQQPNPGLGRFVVDVSRSNAIRHTRKHSSGHWKARR